MILLQFVCTITEAEQAIRLTASMQAGLAAPPGMLHRASLSSPLTDEVLLLLGKCVHQRPLLAERPVTVCKLVELALLPAVGTDRPERQLAPITPLVMSAM